MYIFQVTGFGCAAWAAGGAPGLVRKALCGKLGRPSRRRKYGWCAFIVCFLCFLNKEANLCQKPATYVNICFRASFLRLPRQAS